MLVYDSVLLDREILARQDHLKNARLKTRTATPPSETSERETPPGLEDFKRQAEKALDKRKSAHTAAHKEVRDLRTTCMPMGIQGRDKTF
jgi:hypothetical protein